MKRIMLCGLLFWAGCEDALGYAGFAATGGAAWLGGRVAGTKLRERDCRAKSTAQERCACYRDPPVAKEATIPKECDDAGPADGGTD
jgi:hypothetical protein